MTDRELTRRLDEAVGSAGRKAQERSFTLPRAAEQDRLSFRRSPIRPHARRARCTVDEGLSSNLDVVARTGASHHT